MSFGMGENSGSYVSYLSWGFGYWKPYIVLPEKRFIDLCPYCEIELKNNIYVKTDIFTKQRVFRCGNCHSIIKLENGKWILVSRY